MMNRINTPIPQDAPKGNCVVSCSTARNKQYEFLVRFVEDRALIGAKRMIQSVRNSGGGASSTAALSGKYELINGVTFDCLHCKNSGLFLCSCGIWSCDSAAKPHICPHCSKLTTPEEKQNVENITATETAPSRQAIGHSRSKSLIVS